jgi:dTDP-4-dehydrorhamnose 3,5-epimerase
MKFIPTQIPDVILIEPEVFKDARGFFFESYRKDIFAKNGITLDFIQDNHSRSSKGTLRGLHYQVGPMAQAKLIRVVCGEVFDVAVDVRKGSKTFGQHVTTRLSVEKHNMLFVPEGFAHGILALTDDTQLLYKVSQLYSPSQEHGIRWDDPSLGIAWPKLGVPVILSDKDRKFPLFKEIQF